MLVKCNIHGFVFDDQNEQCPACARAKFQATLPPPDPTAPRSKMQILIDNIRHCGSEGNVGGAVDGIVEALVLLSRAQQQTMSQITQAVADLRRDMPMDGPIA